MIKGKLIKRFSKCRLALHPQKTKIVYCKDASRQEEWQSVSFDFLGYTFQPRLVRDKAKKFFVSFSPAMSTKAAKNIRQAIKQKWKLKMRMECNLKELAQLYNPAIQGWINYYSRFHGSALYSKVFDYLNTTLIRWAMKKYNPLYRRPTRASKWLKQAQLEYPNLFAHWRFKAT